MTESADRMDLRCAPDDTAGLLAEIARRDKIITALMNQVQRNLNSPDNDFALLQTTFVLEEQVKHRTEELEQAHREVEAVRNRLSAAIGSISEGFALFDPGDRLTLCNEVYLRLWELGEDAIGRHFEDLLGEIAAKAPDVPEWLERRIESHRMASGSGEYHLANGRHLQIRERKTPDGCTVGIYADITELAEAQAQALRNEKLAALGRLVVGVAHEINTPLGIGLTAASHLEEQARILTHQFEANQVRRSELGAFLQAVAETAGALLNNLHRAAELVRSFKLVAVDQSSEARRRFNLREYIDEVLLSLRPQLKRTHHQIAIQCPEDLELDGHPGAISQILTNFVVNSLVHGFEGRDDGRMEILVRLDGRVLELRYRDDGAGMTTEDLAKIFEPFFTTKRGRGGSGLGMHIVHTLVCQKLGGRIDCSSAPGRGVDITIRLPCIREGNNVHRLA